MVGVVLGQFGLAAGLFARFARQRVIRREATEQGLPPGRSTLVSPYDLDARYSEKRGTGWTGYKAHLTETCSTSGEDDPDTGRPRKFAYAPGLVVVDGGAPQVAAAQRALDELGIDDIPVCGLAKRLEEVWLSSSTGRAEDPVILPRTSEALYLLQRVRDVTIEGGGRRSFRSGVQPQRQLCDHHQEVRIGGIERSEPQRPRAVPGDGD